MHRYLTGCLHLAVAAAAALATNGCTSLSEGGVTWASYLSQPDRSCWGVSGAELYGLVQRGLDDIGFTVLEESPADGWILTDWVAGKRRTVGWTKRSSHHRIDVLVIRETVGDRVRLFVDLYVEEAPPVGSPRPIEANAEEQRRRQSLIEVVTELVRSNGGGCV